MPQRWDTRGMSKRTTAVVVTAALIGVGLAAFIVYSLTTFERYRVPSESMKPGIDIGTHVALNTRAYGNDKHPVIGDLVIHQPPEGASTNECAVEPEPG